MSSFAGLVLWLGLTSIIMAAPSYPGYIFCASGQYGYLIDPAGTTAHTWKAGGSAQSNAYFLEDGSALFPIQSTFCSTQRDGAFPYDRIQKIAWDGTITWDYQLCEGGYHPGYDLEPMPNGNVLVPADNSTNTGKIYEIQPSGTSGGTVVWSCVLPDSLKGTTSGTGGMGGMGTYVNSVSYNPDLDMVLCELQDPVRKLIVIDHSIAGGKIVFIYNVGTSGRLHACKWVTRYFLGTKTPVPNADTAAMHVNNLLVVHNSSEAVEVNWATKTKLKSITYAFANNEGSVQRLPNGNTLVQKGMQQKIITELDPNGQTLRTVTAPGTCARAYMYGPTYAGIKLSSNIWKTKVVTPNTAGAFLYDAETRTGKITIGNSGGTSLQVRVYSMSGKTVCSGSTREKTFVFSTGTLTAGVYTVDVKHAAGSFRSNFVKW